MATATKDELRRLFREKRKGLSAMQFRTRNKGLLEQAAKLDIGRFATIHLFLPIQDSNEPDTVALAKWIRETFPQIRLVISRTQHDITRMQHVVWDDSTLLQTNAWKIPEPVGGIPVPATAIDAVLVPLLAFDRQGQRVGYGKGYYDRFLADCRLDALKIGLSLFGPIDGLIDATRHDVALDCCITPERIYTFNTTPGI